MKFISKLKIIFLSVFCLTASYAVSAQTPANSGPVLETTLYLLISGEKPTGAKIPAKLDAVSRQIARDHDVKNLQLAATFSGRASQGGSMDARGITQITSEEKTDLSVVNWGVQSLRSDSEVPGGRAVSTSLFRLSVQVPVTTMIFDEQTRRERSVRSNLSAELTITRLTITKDTPTMIGSLVLSEPGRMMFVVLEVREAQ